MYHNYKMAKKKKEKNDELASSWTIEFGQREKVSREKVALRGSMGSITRHFGFMN